MIKLYFSKINILVITTEDVYFNLVFTDQTKKAINTLSW